MQSKDIMIKGNKYGLTVVLSERQDFDELKKCVQEKFAESDKFFGKALMAISFRGRELTAGEEKELVDVIENSCRIKVACIAEQDGHVEQLMQDALSKSTSDTDGAQSVEDILEGRYTFNQSSAKKRGDEPSDVQDCRFYKGTLRSGQVLESANSIIVLGDVNPGAGLVSGGSVIILGALKGMVQAGADGNENAFVAALSMHPMQIRIGDVIARSSDGDGRVTGRRKKTDETPKIAFAENGNIYIEPITKEVLNDLKI